MAEISIGYYRHYKGDVYSVLGTAKHTETGEELVIYYLASGGQWYARPVEMFTDQVEIGGEMVPRFQISA